MIFSFYVIAEDLAAETQRGRAAELGGGWGSCWAWRGLRELLSLEGAEGAAEIVENNVHVSYHEQRKELL